MENKTSHMDHSKDYNFFYIREIKEVNIPLTIIITSALGDGRYSREEINEHVEQINHKNTAGELSVFQDDGENFWNIQANKAEKLDIGSKEDNYLKWEEMKKIALPISIEDLLVFCIEKDVKVQNTIKKLK